MKLNQIVAIEKGVKGRNCSIISELNRKIQSNDIFNGFSKKYSPKNEEGETYPDEKKKVILNAIDVLEDFKNSMVELADTTLTKDCGNTEAFGDIIVDGVVIAEKIPATNLLFLEKQIKDIETFVKNIPTLDETEDWTQDVNSNLFKTEPKSTNKTKKIQKAIVLYNATERHAAQTELISVDETVGQWKMIKQSGALPTPKKKTLLDKIVKLSNAVKFAREQANNTEIEKKNIGEKIFNFILD